MRKHRLAVLLIALTFMVCSCPEQFKDVFGNGQTSPSILA